MNRRLLRGFFYIAVFLLLSGTVMLLWNGLLPQIAHLNIISYWQALGLTVLCRILFGNFHFGFNGGRQSGRSHQFLKDKPSDVNEHERETFKEEWRRRRGSGHD